MNWNKLGAIGSMGSFVFAVLLFAAQVWPYPQWKEAHEQHTQTIHSSETPAKAPASNTSTVPKSVVIFLIAAFLLSSFSIYGAWKRADGKASWDANNSLCRLCTR